MSREQFIEAMRAKFEKAMGQVADAVNDARPGFIITDSEEKVRDVFADLLQEAYELALQRRMDAAEAAFPPSEGREPGKKKRHKGRQDYSVLTVNGRTRLLRVRWHSAGEGSTTPVEAKGWQIGSGPTEATCKTLTARLKGSGMRWESNNGEALMALEALSQSGQCKLYWQTRLRQTG